MNYLKLIRCYISGVVMDNITISNLLSIYDKEISKNVKNKRKLYNWLYFLVNFSFKENL